MTGFSQNRTQASLSRHCCMQLRNGVIKNMSTLSVYIFLLVSGFCMFVTRLRMTLSTENWVAVYCLYQLQSDLLKLSLKLLRQTDNLYSKKSYKMLPRMHRRGITTWVSHVKSILSYYGFDQVWLFGCRNANIFFNELKERLYSSFCHGWCNHLESSERLSFYKEYKNPFEREKYVNFIWMDVYRNAFTQFRMGVFQISDHRHRFSPTARNKACPFCTEEIHTEIYCVLQCSMYTQLKRRYLTKLSNVHDTRSFFLKSYK